MLQLHHSHRPHSTYTLHEALYVLIDVHGTHDAQHGRPGLKVPHAVPEGGGLVAVHQAGPARCGREQVGVARHTRQPPWAKAVLRSELPVRLLPRRTSSSKVDRLRHSVRLGRLLALGRKLLERDEFWWRRDRAAASLPSRPPVCCSVARPLPCRPPHPLEIRRRLDAAPKRAAPRASRREAPLRLSLEPRGGPRQPLRRDEPAQPRGRPRAQRDSRLREAATRENMLGVRGSEVRGRATECGADAWGDVRVSPSSRRPLSLASRAPREAASGQCSGRGRRASKGRGST